MGIESSDFYPNLWKIEATIPGHVFKLRFDAPTHRKRSGFFSILPNFSTKWDQILGKVKYVALVGLVAKILCKFELEGRVYGGDERRNKKNREKRRESLSVGSRAGEEEKRGVR